MNWRVKGVVQGVLSRLPGGGIVNNCLQTTLGNLRDFEANVDAKVLADWLVLVGNMQELGVRPQNLDYVEVGTGWYPALPICYWLAGARSCRTFDVTRRLNPKMTFRMLRRIEHHLPRIAEGSFRPLEEVQAAYASLCHEKTAENLLRAASIEYLAPHDAAASGLPDASVDVVFSNNVLEHVPANAILRIMRETRRILRKGGLAIHSANCGDHYAYFDRSITPVNYLTYPERQWSKWNNNLLYQNRLRPSDFIDLAEQSGLRIVLDKSKPNPQLLSVLPTLEIAPEFQRYPPEQLASTTVDFVAQA
jgi:SAM-dependent methyltransferase